MIQKRYNVFNYIHKGLRGLLYDTAIRIQRTDMGSEEAAEVTEQVKLVLQLFDEHAAHEDKHILPMIMQYNLALVEAFEQDHEEDHRLSEQLRRLTTAFETAASYDEKVLIGEKIFYAFNEFIAFNLYHMNREEDTLLNCLWDHFTEEQLAVASAAIVAEIHPEMLMIESKWMMQSMNITELTDWMNAIRDDAPGEVYGAYINLAELTLSDNMWNILSGNLKLTAVHT